MFALLPLPICFPPIEQHSASRPEGAWSKQSGAMAEDTSSQGKKVAILCRDQSDITIVKELFGDEVLNKFQFFSGHPEAGLEFLHSIHLLRSCFIVMDGRSMEEELHHKSFGTPYEDMLRAAKEVVDTKVVIIICNDKSKVSQNEEYAITHRINLLLGDKGVILWWKGNKYSLPETQNLKRTSQFNRSQSLPDEGATKRSVGFFEPPINLEASSILLKTRLRHGKISYQHEDVERRVEGWEPPKEIVDSLRKKWRSLTDAELLIYPEEKTGSSLVTVVKEGSKIVQLTDSLKGVWRSINPGASCLGSLTGKRKDSSSSNEMDLD